MEKDYISWINYCSFFTSDSQRQILSSIFYQSRFWYTNYEYCFTGHLLEEITHTFIGAAVLFLPLFVFLPKLIRRSMKVDSDVVIDSLGKNEQVKKVFWVLFIAMAGLVLAHVLDPATAQQIVGIITSTVP